jgi:hypothetical protein
VVNATLVAVQRQIDGFKQNGTGILSNVLPSIKFLLTKDLVLIRDFAFIPFQRAGGIPL